MLRKPLSLVRLVKKYEDITAPHMNDNDTWSVCPKCGEGYQEEIAIPGLLQRFQICESCKFDDSKIQSENLIH